MKQKKAYWHLPFMILIIFVAMAVYKNIYNYSSTKTKLNVSKNKNNTYKKNINHTNESLLQLDSHSWKKYYLKYGVGNMFIDRYGNFPLKVRWKSRSKNYWREGTWYKGKKPSFYGLNDVTVVEFKLFPNTKSKTIKVFQK